MAVEVDLLEVFVHEDDQTSRARESLHPHSPIMATSSDIEMIAPLIVVTPAHQGLASIPFSDDSSMAIALACSSTHTDDMLDTVDDCVGCVNQISLQHDFEDSLLDVTLDLQNDFASGTETLSSDDGTKNIGTIITANEGRPISHNIKSNSSTYCEEEYTQEASEIDILNWCSGGFQG
jgi:hypothetical protein